MQSRFCSGQHRKHMLSRLIPVLVLLVAVSLVQAQTVITWDGGGDGASYNDPLNWDLDVVPNNTGPNTYSVVIPMGASVSLAGDFDTPDISPTVVSLDNSGLLELKAQTLTITKQVNGLVNGGTIVQSGLASISTISFTATPTGLNDFNAINMGLIQCAAGTLRLSNAVMMQDPLGILDVTDGAIELRSNSEIVDGSLITTELNNPPSEFLVPNGFTATLARTLLDGRLRVSAIANGATLLIDNISTNDKSVMLIDHTGGGPIAKIELLGDQTFDGAGELVFEGTTGTNFNRLLIPADTTLTVGPDFRIRTNTPQSGGTIEGASPALSRLINSGAISGIASESNVDILNVAILNDPVGLVLVESSTAKVLLKNSRIEGGIIRSLFGEILIPNSYEAEFTNTLIDGKVRINSIANGATLYIDNVQTNDNTVIEIEHQGGGPIAKLEIVNDQIFTGTGRVLFKGNTGPSQNVLRIPADKTLTLGHDFKIQTGTAQAGGSIQGASNLLSRVINLGTISATASESTIDIANVNIAIESSGLLEVESPSSLFLLKEAKIDGGVIRSTVGKFLVPNGFSATIANTLIDGRIRVSSVANGATLFVDQIESNDNTRIEIEHLGGGPISKLEFLSDQQLDGNGVISFLGSTGSTARQILVTAGSSLTLHSDIEIHAPLGSGGGVITGIDLTSQFINNGTIIAEGDTSDILIQGPMRFPSATGTLKATNGRIRVNGVNGPLNRPARVAAHLETGIEGDIADGEIVFENNANVDGVESILNRGVMRVTGTSTRVEGALTSFSTTGILRIENNADLVLTSAIPIQLDGIVSLDVAGSYFFTVGGFDFLETVRFFCGGRIETLGDVVFRQTDFFIQRETMDGTYFWEPTGELVFRGGAPGGNACAGNARFLEAVGRDNGPSAQVATSIPIQKIDVGTNARVVLVDQIDNGNRGGSVGFAEAVYANQLFIEPEGVLDLGVVNLYVGGVAIVPGPYDQGIIVRSSIDCDGNGVPDGCDLDQCDGDPACGDCNGNGIPDSCDIADGLLSDCTGNGIPDQCEPDCNLNGIADSCDILSGESDDCNGNGRPDECEIPAEQGPDFFCTTDCDPDCNENGIPDSCDIESCIGSPDCDDCNNNGVPDSCDIAAGTSTDVDMNGVPDECVFFEPDLGNPNLWSFAQNWPNDDVPGDEDPQLVESVLLQEVGGGPTQLDLDIDVSIDSLVVKPNSSLDFILQGGDLMRRFTIDSTNGMRIDGALNIDVPGEIFATAPFAIRGSQPINLNDPGAKIRSSQVGNTITNFTTIQGEGAISAQFSNRGIVRANVDGGVLSITGGLSKENRGQLIATNNATLAINNTNISGSGTLQSDGGTIVVDPGIGIANLGALSMTGRNGGVIEARGNSNIVLAGSLVIETGAAYRGLSGSSADLAASSVVINGIAGMSIVELDDDMTGTITGLTMLTGPCAGMRGFTDPDLKIAGGAQYTTAGLAADSGVIESLETGILTVTGLTNLYGCNVFLTDLDSNATVSLNNVTISDDVRMSLDGTATIEVSSTFTINGCLENEPECAMPMLEVLGSAKLSIDDDLIIDGDASVLVNSEEAVILAGDFINRSTDPDSFAWSGSVRLSAMSQSFELPSEDRGATGVGFANNFAFGMLRIEPGTTVNFVDQFDNSPGAGCEALYIDTLSIGEGALLNIGDCRIYYQSLFDEGGIIQAGTGGVFCSQAGDFDCNGIIDQQELTTVIDVLLGRITDSLITGASDFNGDGVVDGRDLARLVLALIEN